MHLEAAPPHPAVHAARGAARHIYPRSLYVGSILCVAKVNWTFVTEKEMTMKIAILGLRRIGTAAILAIALAACGASATTSPAATSAAVAPTAAADTTIPTTAAAATSAADTTAAAPATPTAPAAPKTAAPAAATTSVKLNLNTLTADQLTATIPNFGSRMTREFLEYRPYASITQFRTEIGKYVDAAQVATYEQYVYVPIAVDTADAATLQQIPGVDAAAASTLIAARPFASKQAFLTKLAQVSPGADAAAAAAYLAS